MYRAIDEFKVPRDAICHGSLYDTPTVVFERILGEHNRYIDSCMTDAWYFEQCLKTPWSGKGSDHTKRNRRKMLENYHLAALAYNNAIDIYKSLLILRKGNQRTISETTAIRLFSGTYVLIIDHYTDTWCGLLGDEPGIKALQDLWLSMADESRQELIKWANQYTVDDNFNLLVGYMER
jgi:hypothetical protein